MSRFASLLLAPMLVAAAACGSKTGEGPASGEKDAALPEGMVVVTTRSGKTFEFSDFEVACRESDSRRSDPQIVDARSGPGNKPPYPNEKPWMMVTAGDRAADGVQVTFPYDETFRQEETFIVFFIGRAVGLSQLSAGAEGSSGTFQVIRASCEPTPHFEFRIDAKLHSEDHDGGSATVRGDLTVE